MKLMKRDTETTYVLDCFVEAYKTLGYNVVGEEEPTPTAPPQEAPEQEVSDENEYACLFCGKSYSRKGNLDKHIAKEHKEA